MTAVVGALLVLNVLLRTRSYRHVLGVQLFHSRFIRRNYSSVFPSDGLVPGSYTSTVAVAMESLAKVTLGATEVLSSTKGRTANAAPSLSWNLAGAPRSWCFIPALSLNEGACHHSPAAAALLRQVWPAGRRFKSTTYVNGQRPASSSCPLTFHVFTYLLTQHLLRVQKPVVLLSPTCLLLLLTRYSTTHQASAMRITTFFFQ